MLLTTLALLGTATAANLTTQKKPFTSPLPDNVMNYPPRYPYLDPKDYLSRPILYNHFVAERTEPLSYNGIYRQHLILPSGSSITLFGQKNHERFANYVSPSFFQSF